MLYLSEYKIKITWRPKNYDIHNKVSIKKCYSFIRLWDFIQMWNADNFAEGEYWRKNRNFYLLREITLPSIKSLTIRIFLNILLEIETSDISSQIFIYIYISLISQVFQVNSRLINCGYRNQHCTVSFRS